MRTISSQKRGMGLPYIFTEIAVFLLYIPEKYDKLN